LDGLLEDDDKNQELFADSAYVGEKQDETINKYELINKVH